MSKRWSTVSRGRDSFPRPPGYHLSPSNAPLEFAKTMCAVLAVERSWQEPVEKLKRDLMRPIGVSLEEILDSRRVSGGRVKVMVPFPLISE